jgi:PAS domain S-box-containing protein
LNPPELRKSGIEILGDFPWGTHFCQFYETKEDLADILVPYFKAGLENNEFCMWITSAPLDVEEATVALKTAIPALESYQERGQIEIIPYDEWYVVDGVFDSARVLDGWIRKLEEALDGGFDGLRLSGNTFWLEKEDWDDFVEYEEEVDNVISSYPMIAVCTYSLDKCGAKEIIDVVDNHQYALIKNKGRWTQLESKQRKTEESLVKSRENEALLIDILDSAQPFGVGYLDGSIGYVNQALEELTGYTSEELKSLNWETITPPEFLEKEREYLNELHRTGQPARYQKEYVRKDGTRVPIEILVHLKKNNDGTPQYYYSFITDISKQKQALKKLKKSETRFRSVLTNSSDVIYRFNLQTDSYEYMSPAIRSLGFEPEEMMAMSNDEVISRVHPEDRPDLLQVLSRINQTGKGIAEYRFQGNDGTYSWWSNQMVIVNDEDGQPLYRDGSVRDVTQQKVAEYELKRANERLNIASKSAGAGLWDWDLKTGEIEWSPVMFELFGLDPETTEASFETWGSIIHPEDVEMAGKRIDDAVRDHTFLDNLYRIVKPNGEIRWINALGQTEYDAQNNPVCMTGICLDITLRKKIEEDIQLYGNLMRGINKLFSESLTCETDEEVARKCLEVAEELTGSEFGFIGELNADGYLEATAISFPPWDRSKAHPGKIHELIKDMEGIGYWGGVIKEAKSQIENDPDSDGREVPEGHPIVTSFLGVPLKQGGSTMGMIGLANKEDGFTEEDKDNIETLAVAFIEALHRKRAELKLRDTLHNLEGSIEERTRELSLANRYNRNLIETSLDPQVTIGPDGKITDVNKATEIVTGFSREKIIGTKFSDYFSDPKQAEAGYQQVFRDGKVRDYPLEIKHKNGNLTPVLYNASVYYNESGEVDGVFAAARDITEQKKAQDELREYWESLEEQVNLRTEELAKRTEELANSNADLQQFAYVASHDLREPLRMITSFLQLLERRYKDQLDQDANDFIGFAVDGAKRLDKMIMDLLEYSRVANKEMMFNNIDLKEVLDQIILNLQILINENKATISYDKMPVVKGDAYQLILLFQNLIGNAIKYRKEEDPIINITAKKEGSKYLFSVKDNGLGIYTDHLETIFNIFKRLHTYEEYEGSGIGLSIAQRIVHQHGGEIWAESEPGKGSTFRFTIPI